jgi:putative toxin-antitoxin system antitoxin component (TIGR02293 family)
MSDMATRPNPQFYVQEWLGSKVNSDQDVVELVEAGLPLRSVQWLLDKGLTKDEVFSIIIHERTLKHRKSRKQPLSVEESERALRAARVLALAEAVYGSREKALQWMRTPKRRFKGQMPFEMISTEPGGKLVEEMLYQIDEGMFA